MISFSSFRNLLTYENGETTYHLPEDSSIASGFYNLKVQLPQHVTCTQCVLQWRYRTGISINIYALLDNNKV